MQGFSGWYLCAQAAYEKSTDSDFQASCNAKAKSIEHLVFMHLVSVITVVFIHTMEEDQRLNTLGDTLHFSKNHYPSSCLQRTVDNVQSY